MLSSLKVKSYVVLTSIFLLGFIAATAITIVSSHGGDTDLIHGCVSQKGGLRIVGPNENCGNKEMPLDWSKQSGSTELPFFCTGCNLSPASGSTHILLQSSDYSNTILWTANFTANDLSGKNFSHSKMAGSILDLANLSGTNFTGADLRQSNIGSADATGANFTDANLEGTHELDDVTILTDVIWDNTICPDGTNSNNNGNTCEGHLTP